MQKVELVNDKTVKITTIEELPRYYGRARYEDTEYIVESIKDNCDIWCMSGREGFNALNSINDWNPERFTLEEDLESFQEYLDAKHGKGEYIAYALGAYIHSGISFSISKSDDTRCRWDSGTVGFIGVDKTWDIAGLAKELTSAWNGEFVYYEVIDRLNDDTVDELSTDDYKEYSEFNKKCIECYGIDFDKVETKTY